MKKTVTLLGVCALVALALPLSSQQGASAGVRGIYGRWDPGSGIFTPIRQVPDHAKAEAAPPPLTTYTGTIVVDLTITIDSAISTSTTIACNASADVVDSTGSLSDSLSVAATRSGSTATCSVSIPYSWRVSSASDDVYISYDISAPPQPLVSGSAFPRRYSGQPVATITIPASGTTTTYSIAATI